MSIRITLALLSLALTAGPQLSAQEQVKKYRFNEGGVAGDVYVSDRSSNASLDITAVRSDQQSIGPLADVHGGHQKNKDTILAADAQGPTSIRRVFLTARDQNTKKIGGEVTTSVQPRQGKTILAQRKGSGFVVTSVKANGASKPVKLPAAELKQITQELQNDAGKFFPDRELGVGEEWSPPTTGFGQMFDRAPKAQSKARVEEETSFKGHPCVRISLTVQASGKSSGAQVTLAIEGDVFYALDLQRVIQTKMSGPITFKKTVAQGAMPVSLDGQGMLEVSETVQYLQLAGKPAPGAP